MFASGATFATLMMVVLLPLFWNSMTSWWSSNKPDENERALDAAKREGQRLKDKLETSKELVTRVRKQLEDREAWNQFLEDQLETASQTVAKPGNASIVRPPASTDRAPANQDSDRAPRGNTREPLPSPTVTVGDLLKVILIERPLASDRDFARTLELIKEFEDRGLAGEQFAKLPYARRLLTRLSYSDAPNDVGPKPSKPDNEHTEFAFLSGDNGQSVLATIRHGAVLSLYFFELKDGRVNWTAKVSALPGRDPTVLVASPLGQCFIAAQKADDHTEKACLYISSRLYELVNSKVRPKRQPYTTGEQTAIELKPGTSASLAVTDSQLYAFATPPGALQWPQVVIASKGGKETPADLGAFGDNFNAEPVSGITFDPTGHVLAVGLRKSKRLPVFELINDHDKAGPVTLPVYPHAVRSVGPLLSGQPGRHHRRAGLRRRADSVESGRYLRVCQARHSNAPAGKVLTASPLDLRRVQSEGYNPCYRRRGRGNRNPSARRADRRSRGPSPGSRGADPENCIQSRRSCAGRARQPLGGKGRYREGNHHRGKEQSPPRRDPALGDPGLGTC